MNCEVNSLFHVIESKSHLREYLDQRSQGCEMSETGNTFDHYFLVLQLIQIEGHVFVCHDFMKLSIVCRGSLFYSSIFHGYIDT